HDWNPDPQSPEWSRQAATNQGRAIHFQFTPEFGESSFFLKDIRIALAFFPKAGQGDKLIIACEGAERKEIDFSKDSGRKEVIYFFDTKDINRDNRIDIRVLPATQNANEGVFLNTFW